MKKFLVSAAVLVALAGCAEAPQTENLEKVSVATVEQITAPVVDLKFETVKVKTVAAPIKVVKVEKKIVKKVTVAPVKKKVEPAKKVTIEPVKQIVEPVKAVVEPVICEEDMPCWDCKTMGNKICGSVVIDAATECFLDAMAYAPDGTCVEMSFWGVTPGIILPPTK